MKKPSKDKQDYGFTECATISCPRLPNERGSLSILKSRMYQDKSGHYWCDLCIQRGQLMDWAYTHHWPSVRVQGKMRYAVSGEASGWFLSVIGANEDMITALHETLVEAKRAPLPPITH